MLNEEQGGWCDWCRVSVRDSLGAEESMIRSTEVWCNIVFIICQVISYSSRKSSRSCRWDGGKAGKKKDLWSLKAVSEMLYRKGYLASLWRIKWNINKQQVGRIVAIQVRNHEFMNTKAWKVEERKQLW